MILQHNMNLVLGLRQVALRLLLGLSGVALHLEL